MYRILIILYSFSGLISTKKILIKIKALNRGGVQS